MKRFLMLFGLLALMIVPVLSQVEPPGDVFQWFGLLPTYLGSVWGVAVSLPFWVAIFLGLFNLVDAKKFTKYVFTGVVTLVLLLFAYFLPFGYLQGAFWWWLAVNWVGLMVIEILGYSIPMLKAALDAIAAKFNPWKPAEPTG